MVLIIAEKPSLGRNIAAAIGTMSRKNGYLEGNGYIITWAFGHLFSLCDIEDYTGPTATGRWSLENIPCFPENFKFKLRSGDDGVARQFDIIKSLCERDDVETIVNAGDADREGEIIIRLCLQNANTENKVLKRLWLPDQTPQTVQKALLEMQDESNYDRLANEGFARTYIDWLYGVNLTRYATLKTGVLLRVGRVIVPIVKAIYDRDTAIKNFVPEKYFIAASSAETENGETIELQSKQKFSKNQSRLCEELCKKYNEAAAVVTAVKRKKDSLKPGKLFSLSKLQNLLGKKYKMPMEQSLKILQKLYEQGYVTYPRTNSEYLATAEKQKIKDIITGVGKLGYPLVFKDGKNIFDDSKIESHSALTPTYRIPDPKNLSDDEKKVYATIVRRFVAVFCSEECIAEKTEITVRVGDYEDFNLKGTVILQKGWTKYDDCAQKSKILPPLKKGDEVPHDFKPKEKETTPPKHYTIETLNNYLKNPFREEKAQKNDDDDAEDYRAIFEGLELGTEATRTGIIDNAIKSGYITLKKDVYYLLSGGEYLITQLFAMGISMDKYKTGELGKALKKVYHGEMTVETSVLLAKNEIAEVFNIKEQPLETDINTGFFGDEAGVCPLCGERVVRSRYGYGCMGYKNGCKFHISAIICGRAISIANARLLLKSGRTAKIRGFTSKSGKPFDAYLKLENGRAVFDFNDSPRAAQQNTAADKSEPTQTQERTQSADTSDPQKPNREPSAQPTTTEKLLTTSPNVNEER